MNPDSNLNSVPATAEGLGEHTPTDPLKNPKVFDTQLSDEYKLVKVRRPDGTIVTVKRKIKADENTVPSTLTVPKPAPSGGAGANGEAGEKYKIVLVAQPDGSLKKFRRRIVEGNDDSTKQATKVALAASIPKATESPAKKPATTQTSEPSNSQSDNDTTIPTTVTKDSMTGMLHEKPADFGPASLQQALAEQKHSMRQRKMHGFRSKLTHGFAMAMSSSIPAFEISPSNEEGDEEISDDDDWSDDDERDLEVQDSVCSHVEYNEKEDGVSKLHESESHERVAFDGKEAASNLVGTLAARAIAPLSPQPPISTASEKRVGGNAEKSNVTYKFTAKEIKDLDQTADNLRPLEKHWANFSFYLLASLSIILPLLFSLLAIAIFLMNGKRLDSSWGYLPQAIKVGVSAWPIIFAAVVAQVFKTFATYKVERGIKLMELEQLVGSNSFASAVKQPILLRRVDVVSLVLFVTWCVSPLGSSALQRTYSTELLKINQTSTVYYLNTTGPNRIFNRHWTTGSSYGVIGPSYRDALQSISTSYVAIFALPGVSANEYEDNYNHPRSPLLDKNISVLAPHTTSGYGVPMVLNDSIFEKDGDWKTTLDLTKEATQTEITNFVMRSSFFNFTCGGWSVVNMSYFDIPAPSVYFNETVEVSQPCSETGADQIAYVPDNSNETNGTWYCLANSSASTTTEWNWSTSNTTYSRFGFQDPTNMRDPTVNSIEFASKIKGVNSTITENGLPRLNEDSLHSLITCSFTQVFIEYGVACYRTSSSLYGADCYYDETFRPVYQVQDPGGDPGAGLGRELPIAFSEYTNPNLGQNDATTPNEIFLGLYDQEGNHNPDSFNLSALVTPEVFGNRMSYLFNTLVSLGNYYDLDSKQSFMTNLSKARAEEKFEDSVTGNNWDNFVTVPNAYWYHTGPEVFVLNITWAVIFLVCDVILLAAGVICVFIESRTVAPDTLGYVSTVARNSKHLRLPKSQVNSAMSGGERAKVLGSTVVMMQDVRPDDTVGRIALGMKHDKAKKLEPGRLYR